MNFLKIYIAIGLLMPPFAVAKSSNINTIEQQVNQIQSKSEGPELTKKKTQKSKRNVTQVSTELNPPKATQKNQSLEKHGDIRVDPYFWLNQRANPEVIKHLKAENKYTDAVMSEFSDLTSTLYKEIRGRVKEDNYSVPYREGQYIYWQQTYKGKEYASYFRKKVKADEVLDFAQLSNQISNQNLKGADVELLMDGNKLAHGKKYFSTSGPDVSPNGKIMAYTIDSKGRRFYDIYFKNLETNKVEKSVIKDTTGNLVWANDNETIFFTKQHPETLRSYQIYKFNLKTKKADLVYEEKDETFNAEVYKTRAQKYIFIRTSSSLSSEIRFASADSPNDNFQVFNPREADHLYDVFEGPQGFLILSNKDAKNFRVLQSSIEKTNISDWSELIAHDKNKFISSLLVFKNFMALQIKVEGLNRLFVYPFIAAKNNTSQESTSKDSTFSKLKLAKSFEIPFNEKSYNVDFGSHGEFDMKNLRYTYESLKQPASTYEFNVDDKQSKLLKTNVVPNFNSDLYETDRVWVKARDGVKVPMSFIYKKGLVKNNTAPMLIYGYGSYGIPMDIYFNQSVFSLVDRGYVYAIAHIRGGGELGREWYDNGRTHKKLNTFNDFIDCTEYMINEKFVDPKQIFAMGGSAGGLLMGAIMNMRPDLYHGVVAQVPFVDVLTTMLDDSIPLTTGEYDEWGNPNVKADYDYIKSYSPYDNINKTNYPHVLIVTGLNDSQVQYWEPAKWAQKLRDYKTNNSFVLLKTNMDVGHGGASGRFESLKEWAEQYAFILWSSQQQLL